MEAVKREGEKKTREPLLGTHFLRDNPTLFHSTQQESECSKVSMSSSY